MYHIKFFLKRKTNLGTNIIYAANTGIPFFDVCAGKDEAHIFYSKKMVAKTTNDFLEEFKKNNIEVDNHCVESV